MPLYDGFMGQPMEGELYQKAGKFWSIDIDERVILNPSLRLLWDSCFDAVMVQLA
jgi:hypothetical protein